MKEMIGSIMINVIQALINSKIDRQAVTLDVNLNLELVKYTGIVTSIDYKNDVVTMRSCQPWTATMTPWNDGDIRMFDLSAIVERNEG